MRYALHLACRGRGHVEPNPPVGAVIVDDQLQLLAEGWHAEFGGPHAEIRALNEFDPRLSESATLYVTLEPCCHHGKTPPCTRAILDSGIRRVRIGTSDPAAHVNGGGLREMREAGLDVQVGILEAEASRLIAPFTMLQTQGRPWTIAKWAMTLDGCTATRSGHSQWISNERSRAEVHRIRQRMDAVIVGRGTALADDPRLTARPPGPRKACRIVIDSSACLPPDSNLVCTSADIPVMLCTTSSADEDRVLQLKNLGVDVVQFPSVPRITEFGSSTKLEQRHGVDLVSVWQELGKRSMSNVLVEGGAELLGALFDARLIDEVHCFIAPMLFGGETARTCLGGKGLEQVPDNANLFNAAVEQLDSDVHVNAFVRYD